MLNAAVTGHDSGHRRRPASSARTWPSVCSPTAIRVVVWTTSTPSTTRRIKRRNIETALAEPGLPAGRGRYSGPGPPGPDHVRRIVRTRCPPRRPGRRAALDRRSGAVHFRQPGRHDPPAGSLPPARRRRFLFGSSSSVYGNNGKVPFAEDDPVDHPISPYAATKKAGEVLCHAYHHLFGMQVACLRFFTVYGPRQRPEMAIHNFTRSIAEGAPIEQFGDGLSARDYTYVDDIVEGIVRAIDHAVRIPRLEPGRVQDVTLAKLIEKIADRLGRKAAIEELPMQPGDVERTWADTTRALRELGLGAPDRYRGRTRLGSMAWFRLLENAETGGTDHEHLRRGNRLRRSGHGRLLRRVRQPRHLCGQGRVQDRDARSGRHPDLRARAGTGGGAQRQGRPADVHHRPGQGDPGRPGRVHRRGDAPGQRTVGPICPSCERWPGRWART